MHGLAEAANAVLLDVREGRPPESAAGALLAELGGFGRLTNKGIVFRADGLGVGMVIEASRIGRAQSEQVDDGE